MREAIGGYGAYTVLLLFILVVSGFMAYTVSYNRAFQVKNTVISILERNNNDLNEAAADINAAIEEYGYSADPRYISAAMSDGYQCGVDEIKSSVCFNVHVLKADSNSVKTQKNGDAATLDDIHEYNSKYVDVVTFASISIPFFNSLFANLGTFRVTGSTSITREYLE